MVDEPKNERDAEETRALTLATLPKTGITLIPGGKRRRAPKPRPRVTLTSKARQRVSTIVALAAVSVALATLLWAGPITGLASHISSFNANNRAYVIPTPTPSHPIASGEHDFVCAALPFARLAQIEMTSGPNALAHPWHLSVILAQWGIEQGWSMPTYTGYNFGNVSAIAGQQWVSGGGVLGAPQAFAYAPSAEQGVADYVHFAQMDLYHGVAAAWVNGPVAQAYALGKSPWDANHYSSNGNPGSSIVGTMAEYGLQRFDTSGATC